MRGVITKLGNQAKIDISGNIIYRINPDTFEGEWKEAGDEGGFCEICKRSFSSVFELIDHFMYTHRGGDTV